MKLLSLSTLCISVILFAACSSGGGKKVAVWSSGKIQINTQDPKTIDLEPGNQHNELEMNFSGSDKVTISVKIAGGNTVTYDLPDNGLYVLNLQTDTVIGNAVNYGALGRPASITGQQLQHMIDSTQDLIIGKNASDEKKTFFLVPNSVKKITANLNATALSPYKNIPYQVEVDKDGKAPETYKFFSNKQKREELGDLLKRMKK